METSSRIAEVDSRMRDMRSTVGDGVCCQNRAGGRRREETYSSSPGAQSHESLIDLRHSRKNVGDLILFFLISNFPSLLSITLGGREHTSHFLLLPLCFTPTLLTIKLLITDLPNMIRNQFLYYILIRLESTRLFRKECRQLILS